MFFKRKKQNNPLESLFEDAAEYIENNEETMSKIQEEEGLVYMANLLGWFYISNTLIINTKRLKLLPDNPRSQHTINTKANLEASLRELPQIIKNKTEEIVKLKGSNYSKGEILVAEFKRIFLG